PNEIFLAVLEFLPNERLLVLRCISKRFQALVDLILAYRLERNLIDLKLRRGLAQNRYTQSEVSKRPHLRHYGTFLRNVNPHSIIEASWYTMPPAELKTICECLVILKEGTAPDNEDLTSVSWTTTKRIMGRYSFKAWLTNIRLNVNHIAFENVKRVERIIMLDPNITYERVRGVSTTGYNLLIIVAACLQYCSIAKDLKDLEKVIQRLDLSIENARSFL
ncbi:uncharacterized protein BJ171DRAFT_396104, partial [Polychytrium aggregatum]|uniref:uncharacterized protein n=1 Tax=Polychytrium aggregatum TaxID=110093 RepID=UPI0022FF177F